MKRKMKRKEKKKYEKQRKAQTKSHQFKLNVSFGSPQKAIGSQKVYWKKYHWVPVLMMIRN